MLRVNRNVWLRRRAEFCATTILLLLSALFVNAQGYGDRTGGGGENRNNSIQGRISLPSNAAPPALKVRLESSNAPTMTTVSNSEGVFYFNNLNPGFYTVIVEAGDQYESVRENVTIEREIVTSLSHSYSVIIDLREKNSVRQKPAVLNASLANVPKPALEQFKKAFAALNKGDDKTAIERFTEAVRLYPQFAEAYSELGDLYLKAKEFSKAEDALSRALRLNIKDASAQLNYGIALLYQRKTYEAEKELEKAVLADQSLPLPHIYLGMALLGLNYQDYAEKEFLKAISLKGSEKLALPHRYLGEIYWSKGAYKQAGEELKKYLELEPQAPDAEKVRAYVKEASEKAK